MQVGLHSVSLKDKPYIEFLHPLADRVTLEKNSEGHVLPQRPAHQNISVPNLTCAWMTSALLAGAQSVHGQCCGKVIHGPRYHLCFLEANSPSDRG